MILWLSSLVLSCDTSRTKNVENQFYFTPENYTGLNRELQNAKFYCANPDECPKSVGLIFSNIDGNEYKPKIAQCTGFLIADDIVATNSHCIPERLKASKNSCESQIAIRFINSSTISTFNCKEILDFSPIGIFDPDYAFFRITKSSGRQPLLIYKKGLKDNEPIRIAKVTPLSHTIGGQLEIVNCKVGLGTLLNLKSSNAWSMKVGGRFTVDDEFRIQPELKFVEEFRSDYHIELEKNGDIWTGIINSTYSDWSKRIDLSKLKIPISLPYCTDEQLNSKTNFKIRLGNEDL